MTPYRYGYNNPILYRDLFGLIEGSGSQAYTGYVKRTDGSIYFDPLVHDQKDLDPNSALTYLGKRLIGTKQDGSKVWFDENNNSTTTDPGWENLSGVTITGKSRRSADWFSTENILSYSGGVFDIYENTIFSKRKFEYKPSKGPNAAEWTTIWKTNKAEELVRNVNSLEDGYLVLKNFKNAAAKYNLGKNISRAGKILGAASLVATVLDAHANGWQGHHVADLALGAAFTFCPALWGVGLAYLAADLTTQYFTGKSITENLLDAKQ